MMNFSDWLLQRESRAATRARHSAAQGLLPMSVVGSPHGHSTASPFEIKQIKKALKKKKAFRGHKGHRKISPKYKNAGIDSWLKEVDTLKQAVEKLKGIFDKKKSKKPEKPKSDNKDKQVDKPEELDSDELEPKKPESKESKPVKKPKFEKSQKVDDKADKDKV